MTVALGLAIAGGVFALIERGRANDRAAESDAQAVILAAQADAARAVGLTAHDPTLALALAAGAYAAVDPPPLEVTRALVEVRVATASGFWVALEPALPSVNGLVLTIGLSPDASTVVVGGAVGPTGALVRFDTRSAEATDFDLEGDATAIFANAFSPLGTLLVIGDDAGVVWLWDLVTNEVISSSGAQHSSPVTAASFSPDGSTIVTADLAGEIRRWDGGTLEPLENLYEGRGRSVLDIAFDRDGTRIAFVGGPAEVRLSDLALISAASGPRLEGFIHVVEADTGRPIALYESPFLERSIALSQDGSLVAASGGAMPGDGGSGMREIEGGTLKVLSTGGPSSAQNVAFTPDGTRLIATGGNTLLDIPTEAFFSGTNGSSVGGLGFEAGVEFLVAGAPAAAQDIWTIQATGDRLVAARAGGDGVRLMSRSYGENFGVEATADVGSLVSVVFAADGRSVTVAGADGLQTMSVTDLDNSQSPQLTGRAVLDVAQSPTGPAAAIDRTGDLWIWESADPAATPSLVDRLPPGVTAALAFSPGGILATARGLQVSSEVRLYEAPSGRVVGGFAVGGLITDLVFTPDGTGLIVGELDGTLTVFDLEGTALLRRKLGPPINAVAVDETSALIATAGGDNTTRLWDLETLDSRGPRLEHASPVRDVQFSNDGAVVITTGRSGAMRFWDARASAPIGEPLVGHTLQTRGLDVSPDGKLIASVSTDGTVRIWDLLDPEAACRIAEAGTDFPRRGEPAEHGLQYCAEVLRN